MGKQTCPRMGIDLQYPKENLAAAVEKALLWVSARGDYGYMTNRRNM